MYGISADLDLSDLIGQSLDGILLARGSVVFNFTKSKISVQGPIQIRKDDHEISTWLENETSATPAFTQLLGLETTSFSISDGKMLDISFSEGLVLRLIDDSLQYESFQIYLSDVSADLIIV